jgi:hypothetical protein
VPSEARIWGNKSSYFFLFPPYYVAAHLWPFHNCHGASGQRVFSLLLTPWLLWVATAWLVLILTTIIKISCSFSHPL